MYKYIKHFIPMILAFFIFAWAISIPQSGGGYGGLGIAVFALGLFLANIVYLIIFFIFLKEDPYRYVETESASSDVQSANTKQKKNKLTFELLYSLALGILVCVCVYSFCLDVTLSELMILGTYVFPFLFLIVLPFGFLPVIVLALPVLKIKGSKSFKRILQANFLIMTVCVFLIGLIVSFPFVREIAMYRINNDSFVSLVSMGTKLSPYAKENYIHRVEYNGISKPTFLLYKEKPNYQDHQGLIIIDGKDTLFFSYDEILKAVQAQLNPSQRESYTFGLHAVKGRTLYLSPEQKIDGPSSPSYDKFSVDLVYENKGLTVLIQQTKYR